MGADREGRLTARQPANAGARPTSRRTIGEGRTRVAVITIFSGSFCGGDEVAEGVAARLGYERVGDELLDVAADRFGVSRERLARTMEGPPPFLSKLTHEREKNLAYLRAAMADVVRRDNVVYHGFAGHLVPRDISHVLRVCVIANLDHRVAVADEAGRPSEKQAVKTIHKDDGQRLRWTQGPARSRSVRRKPVRPGAGHAVHDRGVRGARASARSHRATNCGPRPESRQRGGGLRPGRAGRDRARAHGVRHRRHLLAKAT